MGRVRVGRPTPESPDRAAAGAGDRPRAGRRDAVHGRRDAGRSEPGGRRDAHRTGRRDGRRREASGRASSDVRLRPAEDDAPATRSCRRQIAARRGGPCGRGHRSGGRGVRGGRWGRGHRSGGRHDRGGRDLRRSAIVPHCRARPPPAGDAAHATTSGRPPREPGAPRGTPRPPSADPSGGPATNRGRSPDSRMHHVARHRTPAASRGRTRRPADDRRARSSAVRRFPAGPGRREQFCHAMNPTASRTTIRPGPGRAAVGGPARLRARTRGRRHRSGARGRGTRRRVAGGVRRTGRRALRCRPAVDRLRSSRCRVGVLSCSVHTSRMAADRRFGETTRTGARAVALTPVR
jgi:hypothetical protein